MTMAWVGGATTIAGIGASVMGQRDARKQSRAAMDAQERANEANLAYQREADQTNWMRYLQSLGYNMGQNPNLPGADEMPYVPTRLAPYMMTNRMVDVPNRPGLAGGGGRPSASPGGGGGAGPMTPADQALPPVTPGNMMGGSRTPTPGAANPPLPLRSQV